MPTVFDNEITNKKNVYETLETALIAALINIKLLSQTLVIVKDRGGDGYFDIIFLVCYSCFLILKFVERIGSKDRWKISKRPGAAFFYIAMLIWYLISLKVTGINFIQLFCYVIMPVFVSSNTEIRLRPLLNTTFIIGLLALPFSSYLLVADYRNAINMDVSYAFLPCVVAGIVHFICCRKDEGKIKYIFYAVSAYYLFHLVMNGMRGTLLCIVVAFLLCFYFGNGYKGITLSKLALTVVLIAFVFAFQPILEVLQSFLAGMDVSVYAIDKFLRLTGDISHGRNDIWAICLEGFWDSPFWGNGIDSFEYFTGIIYPHNFILQFLFEGGLFGVILLLGFAIKGTRYVMHLDCKETTCIYIFVFSVSVPYLLVSANVWLTPLLWLYTGIMIRYSHFHVYYE